MTMDIIFLLLYIAMGKWSWNGLPRCPFPKATIDFHDYALPKAIRKGPC